MKGFKKERTPGVWSLVVYLGIGADGKKKQKWSTFRGGERAAQRELNRLLAETQAGNTPEPGRLSVTQFLERWLTHAKATVSAKTFERYEEIVRKHVMPALGRYSLSKLTPLQIQGAYDSWLLNGRRDGKGGLSAQTVLHHHRVLREALGQAVRWQLLVRNPIDGVDPPRTVEREMEALDESDTVRLLQGIRESWLHMPVLLAAMTGMRRGEILAVRWSDVDLKAGVLHVNRSLQQVAGGRAGISFKQPKTAQSRRPIDLPHLLAEALVKHKGRQAERRLVLGNAWEDNDLIVCDDTGRPIVPNQLTQRYAEAMKHLGFTIRFHDLRHGFASQALQRGENVKLVAATLGHCNPNVTLSIYAHVMPGAGKAAAGRLDDAFRAAMGE